VGGSILVVGLALDQVFVVDSRNVDNDKFLHSLAKQVRFAGKSSVFINVGESVSSPDAMRKINNFADHAAYIFSPNDFCYVVLFCSDSQTHEVMKQWRAEAKVNFVKPLDVRPDAVQIDIANQSPSSSSQVPPPIEKEPTVLASYPIERVKHRKMPSQ
jgi:hypothetical protein